jgi:hypothetical protein
LLDRSRMVRCCSASKPSILPIRFFDRYRHLKSSRGARFSILLKPLLSNHRALQP